MAIKCFLGVEIDTVIWLEWCFFLGDCCARNIINGLRLECRRPTPTFPTSSENSSAEALGSRMIERSKGKVNFIIARQRC